MNWIKDIASDKLFWHVTTVDCVESISGKGLSKSNDGQNGEGIYCIEAKDYDVLDSLLELMGERGIQENKIKIVEFIYSGVYEFCKKDNYIYMNEGWVVIRKDVINSIQAIFDLNDV